MDRQWICIRGRKLLTTEFIHILDSYRCSFALNRIMDYLYETKVITTSKVLARNIWKVMKRACNEELQKSLDDGYGTLPDHPVLLWSGQNGKLY